VRLRAPFRLAVAAASIAAALAAAPARAALFDDEEARKRIEVTNQRLTQVQKQLEDRIAALEAQLKSQGLVELFNQIELVKADAARLRGQIEVLTHELTEAQKRQRDLYVDLDARLRKIESAPSAAAGVPPAPSVSPPPPGTPPGAVAAVPPAAVAAVPPPAAGAAPPQAVYAPPPGAAATGPRPAGAPGAPASDPAAEQRAYDGALDVFKAGNYTGAIASFAAFVRTYPKSPLAPSAQYWIGNAQFAQRDFRAAIASQRQLIAAYPDSQKVPDALLNIATSQVEIGENAAARRTLEEIVARHPQSDAAAKARARLAGR
jgi:tol-pal system protein YbgF